MRLYNTNPDVDQVGIPAEFGGGVAEKDDGGGFDLPHDFAVSLNAFKGQGWEDEGEHQARLDADELKRRQDPASLYDTVERLAALAGQAGPGKQAKPARVRKPRTRKAPAVKKTAPAKAAPAKKTAAAK